MASYLAKPLKGISRRGLDIYFLNQSQNHPWGCCFAENKGRRVKIFTDIDHEEWRQDLPWLFTRGRAVYWHQIRNGIHEYTHAVQVKLGAIQTRRGNHIPRWFEEGMAEYIAYDAIIRKRALSRQQAYEFQLSAALNSNEMTHLLRAYAPSNSPAWPGHVGMIVVAGLLDYADEGPESLIEYTRLAGRYRSHNRALKEVYGISAEEMYAQVEAWRQRVGGNENAVPSRRPFGLFRSRQGAFFNKNRLFSYGLPFSSFVCTQSSPFLTSHLALILSHKFDGDAPSARPSGRSTFQPCLCS